MLRSMVLRFALGVALAAALAAPITTARADDPPRRVFKPTPMTIKVPPAKVGQRVTIPVVFRAWEGWSIRPDFPMGMRLFPPESITAEQLIYKNEDALLEPDQGRIDVAVTPYQAGKIVITAVLTFGVFKEHAQDIEIAKVSIEVDAE